MAEQFIGAVLAILVAYATWYFKRKKTSAVPAEQTPPSRAAEYETDVANGNVDGVARRDRDFRDRVRKLVSDSKRSRASRINRGQR